MTDKWMQKLTQMAGEYQQDGKGGKADKAKWIQQAMKMADEMTDNFETDETKKQKKKDMLKMAEGFAGKIYGFDPDEQQQEQEEEAAKPSSSSSKPPKKRPPPGKPSYLIAKPEKGDNETKPSEPESEKKEQDSQANTETTPSKPKPKKKPPGGMPSYLIAKPKPEGDDEESAENEEAKEQQKQDATIEEVSKPDEAEGIKEQQKEEVKKDSLNGEGKKPLPTGIPSYLLPKIDPDAPSGDGDDKDQTTNAEQESVAIAESDDDDAEDATASSKKMMVGVAAGVAATAAAATTAAVVASKHQQKKDQSDPSTSDISHPSPSAPPASEDTSYYKVTVPAGVAPGNSFKVDVGGKKFEVTCPPNVRPGQKIRVELPTDTGRRKRSKSPKKQNDQGLHYVIVPKGISAGMPFRVNAGGTQFTVNCPQNARAGQRIAVRVPRDSRGRSKSPRPPPSSSYGSVPQPQTTNLQQHYVNVPPNVYPGMPFHVDVRGQRFKVTCPANAQPGQKIAVTLPTGGAGRPSRSLTPPRPSSTTTRTEYFNAVVPAGVGPGQKFKIRAHGKDVIVKCPSNVGPGQTVRVPVTVSGRNASSTGGYRTPSHSPVRLHNPGVGGYRTPSHSPVRLHSPGVGGYGGGGYVTSNPGAGERNLQPYV